MRPLSPWMYWLLRFAGVYNLLAALVMIAFYHEGYRLLGVPKPSPALPVQLTGILVGLFGVGYHLVASNPIENRNILTLGFLSKAISSAVALWYVFCGPLGWGFGVAVFFSDVIYLPFFYVIMRRLYAVAASRGPQASC